MDAETARLQDSPYVHFAVGELADPKTDSIFTAAALGYASMYDALKAEVDRRLAKLPPHRWPNEIARIANAYEPIFGRTLADTLIASYLAGADGLASKLPRNTFGSAHRRRFNGSTV